MKAQQRLATTYHARLPAAVAIMLILTFQPVDRALSVTVEAFCLLPRRTFRRPPVVLFESPVSRSYNNTLPIKERPRNEAFYVRAVRSCKTAVDVQAVLDSSEIPLTPTIAAAALRTCVKYDYTVMPPVELLEIAATGLVWHSKFPTKSNMTLHSIQDVLYAIALLRKEKMIPLASVACGILYSDMKRTIRILEPRRFVEIIEAINLLGLQEEQEGLVDAMSNVLGVPGAFGKLSSPKLVEGLKALVALPRQSPPAIRGFMARLRKQATRRQLGPAHVTMAVKIAGQMARHELAEDASMMAYSLVTRELERPILDNTTTLVTQLTPSQAATCLFTMSVYEWSGLAVEKELCAILERRVEEATLIDINFCLQAFVALDIDRPNLVLKMGQQVANWTSCGFPVELKRINSVLRSVAGMADEAIVEPYLTATRSILRDQAYKPVRRQMMEVDVATFAWFLSKGGQDADTAALLGDALLSLDYAAPIRPSSFVMAVRFGIVLSRNDPSVIGKFIEAAERACTEQSDFLSSMNAQEFGYLLEALAVSRSQDEELVTFLLKVALQGNVLEETSPSTSCHIMTAVANLASYRPNDELYAYQRQIFESLGVNLLSSTLKPYQAASSVFAYAKAGYTADLGVFDHLTHTVSQSLSDLETKSLARALRSCGKMYTWEPQHVLWNDNGDDDDTALAPPYVNSARRIAHHLASSREMCAKDLAQSLWAIAKLGFDDEFIVESFARGTSSVLSECNTCEISNMILGLSKCGFGYEDVILALARRVLDADVHPYPKEAASILYSLASLGIRDDDVYERLSDSLMSQMDRVNAQCIANALWAHNVVDKQPPDGLLNSWASEKLGLVGVPSQVEADYELDLD